MKDALIKHGFLEPEFYARLRETYPEPPKGGFRGHYDLSHTDPRFRSLNPAWNALAVYLTGRAFWERAIRQFPTARPIVLDRFQQLQAESPSGETKHLPDCQYPRVDIGWGLPGYGVQNGGKGNHIDNRNRIISGLLYFTDQSELEGGEFELTDAEGNTLHRVPIRENMCIMSVQNSDGWHRVNPLRAAKDYRRAVYFALSDTRNVFGR